MDRSRGRELMLPLSDPSDEDTKRSGQEVSPLSCSSGRKPRGRPPGSKNRPKAPVVITRESESAMRPAILEIAAGHDVLEASAAFSRKKRLGVSILSGSGAVLNLSLRNPAAHSSTISFPGRFEILSLAGTFLPPDAVGPAAGAVTVSVAGGLQGKVIGGVVAGALIAASTVVLVVATFERPEFHHLPIEDVGEERKGEDDDVKTEAAGGSGVYVGPRETDMVLWGTPRAPPPHSHRPPPPPRY